MTGPIIVDGQKAHSISHERLEIINSMHSFLKQNVNLILNNNNYSQQRPGPKDIKANREILAAHRFLAIT